MWSEFPTGGSQFWGDLWIFLLGACELVYSFVFDREKAAVIMLRMLADTVQARI
jgi:hypothetical protein